MPTGWVRFDVSGINVRRFLEGPNSNPDTLLAGDFPQIQGGHRWGDEAVVMLERRGCSKRRVGKPALAGGPPALL